jgi:hypothetical protein
MLRKVTGAIFILFLMAGAAFAQIPQPGVHLEDKKPSRTKEQQEYDKALDRAYRSTIKKIPEAEKKSDPWGDIRPTLPAAAKNKQQ